MSNPRQFVYYIGAISLVLGWWLLAFNPFDKKPTVDTSSVKSFEKATSIGSLTQINREVLCKALAGDFSLMSKLIADWDVDAQILQITGRKNVKRLPRHLYLRSQVIGRQLTLETNVKTQPRILPQTHATASFSLAIAGPAQIVALPAGLRKQTHIFPTELTKKIPLDIDRYNAETLFLAHPEIAFVAHYSHPATINALQQQNVKLVYTDSINSLSEIKSTLTQIGKAIDHPLEADLLAIFIDSAMMAIDNCLLPLFNSVKLQTLFLYHHSQFTIPTLRTLTGQMLQRIGIQNEKLNNDEWLVPIDREQILAINPENLIIATSNALSLHMQILSDPALTQLRAIQQGHLYFVDEAVQQFPSQYVVLAYYDIVQALIDSTEQF